VGYQTFIFCCRLKHFINQSLRFRDPPGSRASTLSVMAFSTSKLPNTLSSVAPSGRSNHSHFFLNWQFFTVLMLGRILARAPTTVVFPKPFGPRMSKPPTFGLIALIMMASFSLSKPTIAENGYTTLLCMRQSLGSGLFNNEPNKT